MMIRALTTTKIADVIEKNMSSLRIELANNIPANRKNNMSMIKLIVFK